MPEVPEEKGPFEVLKVTAAELGATPVLHFGSQSVELNMKQREVLAALLLDVIFSKLKEAIQ